MAQISENHSITSVEAAKAIRKAFKKQRPVFLWGSMGIGKSEVVQGIADSLGYPLIDIRLAQCEPTDIRGIPFFNKEIGKMDWAPPVDLPDEEFASQYPGVVLFLDEMNSAPTSVQAAA
jgi:MoxR-like ATPase